MYDSYVCQQDFVNYRGKTADTNEYYTEIVSDFIIGRIDQFISGIPTISRTHWYKVNHDGNFTEGTGRIEEITAIKMFNQCSGGNDFDYIGTMLDYQTPLKSVRTDKAGKIDLLSYDGTVIRVLELKRSDSKETMLQCVLEEFTYLQTVDKVLLRKDFGLPENTLIKASPFVFRGGVQWPEWKENRPMLNRLMERLDSKPFFIVESNGSYSVVEE
ncbi:MAG: hypothetical protein Q4D07_03740 [Selenomonadaceae bacterium]|nr:hypothetical protein [Selenomonadaceae bacterium]